MAKKNLIQKFKALGIIMILFQGFILLILFFMDFFRKQRHVEYHFPKDVLPEINTENSTIKVYCSGLELYEEMLAEIENAKEYIYFETYIWKDDEIGQRFKEAFAAAAERGVSVYLAYDIIGNLVVPQKFFIFPDKINVLRHHPFTGFRLFRLRFPGVNHRKLLVVDGKVGFLGGYNIGSLFARYWRDTHIKVTGSTVAEFEEAFVDYWNRSLPWHAKRLKTINPRSWDPNIKLIRNVPSIAVYPIRYSYLDAIERASERIWLTHAYLLPDDDIFEGLIAAAERGVDVRIILSKESNHIVADWISRGFYETYLRHGIRIFLYQDTMVHAKTATIDGIWSTIGTANLDRLSLIGNFELNVTITNEEMATQMEDIFRIDLESCQELTLTDWQQRSFFSKVGEWAITPLRPLL